MSENIIMVPKIAITTESDDNETQKPFAVEESHTDIEDLGFENSGKSKPKSRLKIKIVNNGYVTDTEDLELSGAEEEYKIPSSPLPDNVFDLESNLVEEMQHADITSGKVVFQKKMKYPGLVSKVNDDRITDIEDCCTENELDEDNTPVPTFSAKLWELDSNSQEQITENIIVPDDEQGTKKAKSSRRRRRRGKYNNFSPSHSDNGSTISDNTLFVASDNLESTTDVEDIYINEKKKTTQVPTKFLEEELKEQEKTDTESLQSDTDLKEDYNFDENVTDVLYFEKNCNATTCIMKDECGESKWKEIIKCGKAEETHSFGANNVVTDEEALSDFDCYHQHNRSVSPNLHLFEEAVVCCKERTKESDYLEKTNYVSDSEEVVIAGDEKRSLSLPKIEDDCLTEVEDIDVNTPRISRPVKLRRQLFTPAKKNLDFSDDEDSSKQSYTRQDQQATNFHRKKLIECDNTTDLEDLEASGDDLNVSRAETATPTSVHYNLDSICSSKVHSEHLKKIDLSTPEEQLYVKGGKFDEIRTDHEDLSVSEEDIDMSRRKRLSVDLAEDKITVTVKQSSSDISLKWNNCTVQLGFAGIQGKGQTLVLCLVHFKFVVRKKFH